MDELQYFTRRLTQEATAALAATCEPARQRHQELAEAYRLRVHLLTNSPPQAITNQPKVATSYAAGIAAYEDA